MAWKITATNADLTSRTGWTSVDYVEGMDLPFRFRMLDDDRNVYYEGVSSDNDSDDAFAPLDHLGTPDAGCVSIEYLSNGQWEEL